MEGGAKRQATIQHRRRRADRRRQVAAWPILESLQAPIIRRRPTRRTPSLGRSTGPARRAMSAQLFSFSSATRGRSWRTAISSPAAASSPTTCSPDRLFATLNLSITRWRSTTASTDAEAAHDDAHLVVYLQARTDVLLDRIRKRGRSEDARSAPSISKRSRGPTPSSSSPTTRGLSWWSTPRNRLRQQPRPPARAARRHRKGARRHQPLESRVTFYPRLQISGHSCRG